MGTRICEAGDNLEIWRVGLDEIDEQSINANVMSPEMFNRLSDNIKKEGRLESLPFAVLRGNRFELVSGHHRVRAARAAGLTECLLLADTRNLERSAIVAKQLAHNAIDGDDDKEILKRLFGELATVDDVLESFIDPKAIGVELHGQPLDLGTIEFEFPWRQISFTFLPEAMESFDELAKRIPDDAATIGVVSTDLFERFRKALIDLGKTEDIRMTGAIIARMVEVTEEYLAQKALEAPVDGEKLQLSAPELNKSAD